ARERLAAFDDELLHEVCRRDLALERLGKGIEGHLDELSGLGEYSLPLGRAPIRFSAWPFHVTRPGLCSANGPSPTRSESTSSVWRRRCARTPASTARTRSCGPSPGSSTTSITSVIRTWRPVTRGWRSRSCGSAGTRTR